MKEEGEEAESADAVAADGGESEELADPEIAADMSVEHDEKSTASKNRR